MCQRVRNHTPVLGVARTSSETDDESLAYPTIMCLQSVELSTQIAMIEYTQSFFLCLQAIQTSPHYSTIAHPISAPILGIKFQPPQ